MKQRRRMAHGINRFLAIVTIGLVGICCLLQLWSGMALMNIVDDHAQRQQHPLRPFLQQQQQQQQKVLENPPRKTKHYPNLMVSPQINTTTERLKGKNQNQDVKLESLRNVLAKQQHTRITPQQHPPTTKSAQNGKIKSKQQIKMRKDDIDEMELPILIIGGTDGSGTRAFVNILHELGVPILFEDATTFDIHGMEMFRGAGWPALVHLVLNRTHSANYTVNDAFPPAVMDTILKELKPVFRTLESKYTIQKEMAQNPILFPHILHPNAESIDNDNGLVRIHSLNHFPIERATNVRFAIKAPVALLLLPILSQLLGRIKFLHVVRDGRDIALSSNQSPVLKFYKDMYAMNDYQHRIDKYQGNLWNVRGIQLWNDWNLQVQSYVKEQQNRKRKMTNGINSSSKDNNATATTISQVPIDYLWMRSEDLLVSSSPQVPFEAYETLAKFVGSPYLNDKKRLCCMSQRRIQDFGPSVVHQQTQKEEEHTTDNGGRRRRLESIGEEDKFIGNDFFSKLQQQQSSVVKKRYGKWQSLLVNQTRLSNFLHQEGANALKAFGYKPFQQVHYPSIYKEYIHFLENIKERSYNENDETPPFVCDESIVCH